MDLKFRKRKNPARQGSKYKSITLDLLNMAQCLIRDIELHLDIDESYSFGVICHGFNTHGEDFLTKTLPTYGKHIFRCVEKGYWEECFEFPDHPRWGGPQFLRPTLAKIFHLDESNRLISCMDREADALSILCIRQLCFMFYKLLRPTTTDQILTASTEFIEVDKSVLKEMSPDNWAYFHYVGKLYAKLLRGWKPSVESVHNGPGAALGNEDKPTKSGKYPGRKKHERYRPHVVYEKLHQRFNYVSAFYCSLTDYRSDFHRLRTLPKREYGVCQYEAVPKDSRGPRGIVVLPSEYTWVQQGVKDSLVSFIENDPILSTQINFESQEINGLWALIASVLRDKATIDLKTASDLVGRIHMEEMPHADLLIDLQPPVCFLPALQTHHVMNKYAPMGSALCFPVMSLVHYVFCVASLVLDAGFTERDALGEVYVYGDDIVVPSKAVDGVMTCLTACGLIPNRDKSYSRSHFRESCGIDAYNGVDVTPVRMKRDGLSGSSAEDLLAAVALFEGLTERGFWTTAKYLQGEVTKVWGNLPCVRKDSGIIGWKARHPNDAGITVRARKVGYEVHSYDLATDQPVLYGYTSCGETADFGLPVGLVWNDPPQLFDGWPRLLRSLTETMETTAVFGIRYVTLLRWGGQLFSKF